MKKKRFEICLSTRKIRGFETLISRHFVSKIAQNANFPLLTSTRDQQIHLHYKSRQLKWSYPKIIYENTPGPVTSPETSHDKIRHWLPQNIEITD